MRMIETKRFSLVKPTKDTPFHIDFDWWQQHDSNWHIYLLGMLCQEHQQSYANVDEQTMIDWVDPETAEVTSLDGLQHILISHCARQPEFRDSNTTLVDAVFRSLLANGNQPMTPAELSELVGRPAETILRTLQGPQIYKGLRPTQR